MDSGFRRNDDRGIVGWAKARSAVPTRQRDVAWARFALPTLRCHPTKVIPTPDKPLFTLSHPRSLRVAFRRRSLGGAGSGACRPGFADRAVGRFPQVRPPALRPAVTC